MKRWGPVSISTWAVLTACGSVPETHYYVLATTRVVPSEAPAVDRRPTVGVETFAVDPPYDQGLLVYRLAANPAEVGFYDYHRWASPLGSLAAVAFTDSAFTEGASTGGAVAEGAFSQGAVAEGGLTDQAVRDSASTDRGQPAGAVAFEPAASSGAYAAILSGRVVYLEEVDYPDGQLVRIGLDLTLESAAGEALWERSLMSETKIHASAAGTVVEQMRADFRRLVESARSEITTLLSETPE